MKKLDWYILRKFLGTFFFIIAMIMIIGVVFDASEKMDDFIDSGATVQEIIGDYYVNFIIHYANMLSSFFLFIAVIVFTSKMAQNSEIVAILSSGISYQRMLRPYFIAATIIFGLSLYLNQSLLPHANEERLNFERNYLNHHGAVAHFYLDNEPNVTIYFERFHPDVAMVTNVVIQRWKGDTLDYALIAEEAHWDSLTEHWRFEKYMERFVGHEVDSIARGIQKDTAIALHPDEFYKRPNVVETMDYGELDAFIESETERGSDKIQNYLVKKHQRTAYPFAAYILTLIGVSVSSRKVKGGLGLHIAAGVILTMFYFFFQRMAEVAALNIGMNAFFAVWIPNIIFAALAILLYRRAPK